MNQRPKDKVFVVHGSQRDMGRIKTVSLSFSIKDADTVSFGLSTVHSMDHFVKSTGREMSLARLQQTPEELVFSGLDLYQMPTADLIGAVTNALQIGYRDKGRGNK